MVTRDLPKDSRGQGGAALATITTESGLLMSKTRIREHERESVCVGGHGGGEAQFLGPVWFRPESPWSFID